MNTRSPSGMHRAHTTCTAEPRADKGAERIIEEREERQAKERIAKTTLENPERKPRNLGKVETAERPEGAWGIFDAIDAEEDSAYE